MLFYFAVFLSGTFSKIIFGYNTAITQRILLNNCLIPDFRNSNNILYISSFTLVILSNYKWPNNHGQNNNYFPSNGDNNSSGSATTLANYAAKNNEFNLLQSLCSENSHDLSKFDVIEDVTFDAVLCYLLNKEKWDLIILKLYIGIICFILLVEFLFFSLVFK